MCFLGRSRHPREKHIDNPIFDTAAVTLVLRCWDIGKISKYLWRSRKTHWQVLCLACKSFKMLFKMFLQMFFKIDVLKNFAIFTGKHLCRSYLRTAASILLIKKLLIKYLASTDLFLIKNITWNSFY